MEMLPFAENRTRRDPSHIPGPPLVEYPHNIQSKLIHIDSRFAVGPNSRNEYTIELAQPLHQVRRLSVEEIDLPVSFFNISAQLKNNFITFTTLDELPGYVVYIPDGYYTTSTLAVAVATQCNATIPDLDLEVTASNFIVTITANTTPDSASFYVEWGDPVQTNQTSHTLGYILGFRTPHNLLEETGFIRGTSPCLLNTVMPYLFFSMDDSTNSRQNQVSIAMGGSNSAAGPRGSTYLASDTILAKVTIPGTPAFGDRVIATTTTGYMTAGIRKYSPGTTIHRLTLSWLDVMGNPVSLHHIPFSVCLRVDCV
jgi:hypothetical protein